VLTVSFRLKALDAVLKSVCAALLESDVNVLLVKRCRERVKAAVLPQLEELQAKQSGGGGADAMQGNKAKQMIQKAIFDELVRLVDPGDSAPPAFNVRPARPPSLPLQRGRPPLNSRIPMPRAAGQGQIPSHHDGRTPRRRKDHHLHKGNLKTRSLPLPGSVYTHPLFVLTTAVIQLATHYQRRGLKVALVCADTFRAGAFDQLKQNAVRAKVPFFGR
jgi:signal recognition particle subunit SRP54